MEVPPAFFVPEYPADQHEIFYAELAARHGIAIPPLMDRIYSVTFGHDGILWTATVGRSMQGVKGRMLPRKVWKETAVTDNTVIAAIFPGTPYFIFHVGQRSAWAYPFMAGDIRSFVRFSAA